MKKQISLCALALAATIAQADCPPCAEQTISLRDMASKIEGIEFRFSIMRKPGCDQENWTRVVGMAEECARMCQSTPAEMSYMPEVTQMMCQMAECCKMDKNMEANLSIGAFTESEEETRQVPTDESCVKCDSSCENNAPCENGTLCENGEPCQDGVCPAVKSEETCCASACPETERAQDCDQAVA